MDIPILLHLRMVPGILSLYVIRILECLFHKFSTINLLGNPLKTNDKTIIYLFLWDLFLLAITFNNGDPNRGHVHRYGYANSF